MAVVLYFPAPARIFLSTTGQESSQAQLVRDAPSQLELLCYVTGCNLQGRSRFLALRDEDRAGEAIQDRGNYGAGGATAFSFNKRLRSTGGLIPDSDERHKPPSRITEPKRRRKRVQLARLYPERPSESCRHARALLNLVGAECPDFISLYIPKTDLERPIESSARSSHGKFAIGLRSPGTSVA
jgi:hypothetical protein